MFDSNLVKVFSVVYIVCAIWAGFLIKKRCLSLISITFYLSYLVFLHEGLNGGLGDI